MQKNRIAYLCCSESWGGLEMNQLRNASWMKERGHDVVLLVYAGTKIALESEAKALPQIIVSPYKKYWDFIAAWRLSRVLSKEQVTHLIVRDPKDLSLAALVKRILGKKITLAYFMEMQLGKKKLDFLHTLRFSAIDVWSCPLPWLVKQVMTYTKFPAHRLVEIPSGLDLKHLTCDMTTNEARAALNLPSSGQVLGLIGRFDRQKGQHLVLAAFKGLTTAEKENLSICFLGEKTVNESDDYYQSLVDTIVGNNWQEKVFFRPFRKDVPTFFKAIDAMIMASKAETFGMVTVESLACGKPVIGSNAGGTPELLQHGKLGFLFEPMNADDLTKQIRKFIQGDKWDEAQLKESVQRFDAAKVCDQVEQVLKLKA